MPGQRAELAEGSKPSNEAELSFQSRKLNSCTPSGKASAQARSSFGTDPLLMATELGTPGRDGAPGPLQLLLTDGKPSLGWAGKSICGHWESQLDCQGHWDEGPRPLPCHCQT